MTALTPAQIDALPDYTNAQMAKLHRYAITELTTGGVSSKTIAGRTFTFNDLTALRDLERYYNRLANDDAAITAGATSGCPRVAFQEPR